MQAISPWRNDELINENSTYGNTITSSETAVCSANRLQYIKQANAGEVVTNLRIQNARELDQSPVESPSPSSEQVVLALPTRS